MCSIPDNIDRIINFLVASAAISSVEYNSRLDNAFHFPCRFYFIENSLLCFPFICQTYANFLCIGLAAQRLKMFSLN